LLKAAGRLVKAAPWDALALLGLGLLADGV
jgi:hypothetical protein